MREDLSETTDLAAEHPDLVRELVELWWEEARRNQVLPLDNRVLWALVHPKPDKRRPREQFRYFQGGAQVPETVAVNVRNRSHALIVDVELDGPGGTDGVLLALGSALGGFSLHILDGKIRYVHNLYGKERHTIASAGCDRAWRAPDRVRVHQGRGARRNRRAPLRRTRGRDRHHPAVHAVRVQRRPGGTDLRLRVGSRGRRRVCGTVHVRGEDPSARWWRPADPWSATRWPSSRPSSRSSDRDSGRVLASPGISVAGNVSVTRSPCGSFRLASAAPWWVAATAVTMASPSPEPGHGVSAVGQHGRSGRTGAAAGRPARRARRR